MTEFSQTKQEEQPGKKIGRPNYTEQIAQLTNQVDRLEKCLAKIAHYSGNSAIIRAFGIEVWEPGKQDMSKYKN
jgi:hypothetical protein